MDANLSSSITMLDYTEMRDDLAYINRHRENAENIRNKFISDGEYLYDPYPYTPVTHCERCGGTLTKRLQDMNITHCEECL